MKNKKEDLKPENQEAAPAQSKEEPKEKPNKAPWNKKRLLWIIVAVIAAVIAVVAVVMMVRTAQAEEASRRAYEQMAAVTPEPTSMPTPVPTVEKPAITDGKQPSDRQIAFDQLIATNEDVIGWISIPGTQIDYPIMKGLDNDYYIGHDMMREESPMGAIFIDMVNNPEWKDRNTLIYGHNMKNGSMFAQLHSFEDSAFFAENNIVKIYVPDGMYVYQIFAAYPRDDADILNENDFANTSVWEQYIADVLANEDIQANIDGSRTISVDDKIITLSTCIKDEPHRRYVVQAVLDKTGALS